MTHIRPRTHRAINDIIRDLSELYCLFLHSLQAVYFYFSILYIFRVQFLSPLTLLEKAVKQLP